MERSLMTHRWKGKERKGICQTVNRLTNLCSVRISQPHNPQAMGVGRMLLNPHSVSCGLLHTQDQEKPGHVPIHAKAPPPRNKTGLSLHDNRC